MHRLNLTAVIAHVALGFAAIYLAACAYGFVVWVWEQVQVWMRFL